jgi:hypothetical protein
MKQPLVSSFFKCWGQHCASRNGEARQTDRGPRAGQRYEDGFPRNLGGPVFDQPYVALRHGAI